jgi:rhamnulose-1-phosphate aldolase
MLVWGTGFKQIVVYSLNLKNKTMQLFKNQNMINQVLREIELVANNLFQKGWSEKNAGNISVKLSSEILFSKSSGIIKELPKYFSELANSCFFVTSMGSRMQDVALSALNNGVIICINDKGSEYKIISDKEQSLQPTSELPTHLSIHSLIAKRGSSERVVLHTHATELITLTHHPEINCEEDLNRVIWGMHPETIMFIPKGIGFVEFMLPGTTKIAIATLNAFRDHDIVMWDRHGVFAIGRSAKEAFDTVDIACKSAGIYLSCLSAGFMPKGLPDEYMDKLREIADY